METASRRSSGPVLRSCSPAGRFYSINQPSSSSSFASSSSSFSSPRFTGSLRRSASPARVSLCGSPPSSSPPVRLSIIDRSISPSRSISVASRNQAAGKQKSHLQAEPRQRRTCMCSPTTHPGSFRCSLHKNFNSVSGSGSYPSNRLNARRSAMTNSLVRIGTVEGDLVRRALAALIRPSSHHQRRRADFQPRPSRLSVMSTAAEQVVR